MTDCWLVLIKTVVESAIEYPALCKKGQKVGITIPNEHLQFQIGSPEKRDETILLLSGEESHPGPAFEMLVPGHHGQIVYFGSRKDEPVRYTAFKFSPCI